MTRLLGWSERYTGPLLVAAALFLLLAGAGVTWARVRETRRTARDRAIIDSLTHVASAARARADSLAGQYRVDTVRVRETTTIYRAARAAVETLRIAIASGETLQVDTLPAVRGMRLACDATIAARDTAITTCEQRVAAIRALFISDSSRQDRQYQSDARTWKARERTASRRGFRRGALVGAVGAIAAAIGLRQITH